MIATTNLSTEADFNQALAESKNPVRDFTLDDYRKTLGSPEGRFETDIFIGDPMAESYKSAPECPDGPLHKCCMKCGELTWRWNIAQAVHPIVYSARDLHLNSDEDSSADESSGAEECDDRGVSAKIGELKTAEQKLEWLTRGLKWKRRRQRKKNGVSSEVKNDKNPTTKWVRVTEQEEENLKQERIRPNDDEEKAPSKKRIRRSVTPSDSEA